ncbi:MAG: flagellin FliC3 [Lachnospiraceae bacterium]|jgi:flagellin|nr:flagellin FliC3 [Lachnospiraceae bacterium]
MRVNYNVSAIIAQNALSNNDKKVNDSLGRLSSGLKIVGAKDNPSGLAMARRMNAQIKSMQKANDSANDGINIIKTADGVLSEVHDMLQRMNELATRAATDTLQSVDREYIQEEISHLKSEIQRISDTTQFNGQNLLDGTFDQRGYAVMKSTGATDPAIKVATFTEEMPRGKFTVEGLKLKLNNDPEVAVRNTAYDDKAKMIDPDTVSPATDIKIMDYSKSPAEAVIDGADGNVTVEVKGDQVTISDSAGRSITLQIDKDLNAGDDIEVELTDIGALTVQIGPNEGQTLDVKIPAVNLTNLGIRFTDCSTAEWAREAIDDVKGALDFVSRLRSSLGAYQNRMEHTVSSLDVNEENLTSAYSRIMDVDMAEEMTEYSTTQVLTQAGISMLAQANQRPSDLLQLLQ